MHWLPLVNGQNMEYMEHRNMPFRVNIEFVFYEPKYHFISP